MTFLSFNGRMLPENLPLLTAGNTSFKWGEGLFETMKLYKGTVLRWPAHHARLLHGCSLLGLNADGLDLDQLREEIGRVAHRNGCETLARVRLHLFREQEERTGWILQAQALPPTANTFDPRGDRVDLFPHARKSVDALANCKTASYLPYALAARWARKQGLGDALLLNSENRLCDSSRANLFLLKDGEWYTPPLTEGPVAGVFRAWLIDVLKEQGRAVHQQPLDEGDLAGADEVFLTNSIQDIRPVHGFRDRTYDSAEIERLYNETCATFYR